MLTGECRQIFEGIQEIHYLWGAPVEATAIIILLATLVGKYCVPAVIIICAIVPAQYCFGFMIIKNKIKASKFVSERWSVFNVRP